MILYLTSNANVSLLDKLEVEQELPVKKLTGQFSLHSFVIKDMRHFSHVRYVVIDRSSILESDEEMIQALLSFKTMYEIRVIIIAEGLAKSSPLFQKLIQGGILNVAISESIETILREIEECFSDRGMQHSKFTFHFEQEHKSISSVPSNNIKYEFGCKNIHIAIAGSDRRVGVTTTAINLAFWINAHGGNACYLEGNEMNHLAHIIRLYAPDKVGNAFVLENLDFYVTPEFNHEYNFIVEDCGILGYPHLQDAFCNADIRLLCGSVMPYELPAFYRSIERCNHLTTYAVGLFSPENLKPLLLQTLTQNILFGESSHDLFNYEVNTQIHLKILKDHMKPI